MQAEFSEADAEAKLADVRGKIEIFLPRATAVAAAQCLQVCINC